MDSRRTEKYLSLIPGVGFFVGLCLFIFVPAEEDAFIYYRYALHFAQGNGLVFNPNEWVEGYSSFLWMWMLVCLAMLNLDLPVAASILSIFFGAATVVLSYSLAIQMNLNLHGRSGAVFAVALFYPLLWWSKSGLETSFYTFLLTGFAVIYLSEQSSLRHALGRLCKWRHHACLGIIIFLLSITRPEAILLVLVVVIDRWFGDRNFSELQKSLWPVILGYFIFLVIRYQIYGSLTPNTSIKFNPYYLTNGLYQAWSYFLYIGIFPLILPIACWFYGGRDEKRGFRFMILMIVLLSVFFAVFSGGDYRDYFRFLVPTFPLVMVLFFKTIEIFSIKASIPVSYMKMASWAGLFIVLFPSLLSIGENISQDGAWTRSLREWRNPLENRQNYHVIAAHWILEHVPPGQVVAFGQMGKAPYFSLKAEKDIVFVDTLGLLDAEIARIQGWRNKVVVYLNMLLEGLSLKEAYAKARDIVYEQAIEYILVTRRPDLFIIESVFIEKPLMKFLLSHPKFSERYSFKVHIPSQTAPLFVVYSRDAGMH